MSNVDATEPFAALLSRRNAPVLLCTESSPDAFGDPTEEPISTREELADRSDTDADSVAFTPKFPFPNTLMNP